MQKGAIIIIEDDPDDRQVLQEVFDELKVPHPLQFFEDAHVAFNHLMSMKEKPFLIVSDINLPGMNGIEFKQKIDCTDYLRHKAIPFVFLTTADSEKLVRDAYRAADLQGYFKKKSTFREIREQVKCILEYWSASLHPPGN